WFSCAYLRLARSVDGMVAGSGDATATIAGTPIAWSRGLETAAPPLPNAPDRKPTPAPISSVPTRMCSSTTPLNRSVRPWIKPLGTTDIIGFAYEYASGRLRHGAPPRRVRAGGHRPRQLHRRGGSGWRVPTVVVGRHPPARGRARGSALRPR